jgi:hypothetical protein
MKLQKAKIPQQQLSPHLIFITLYVYLPLQLFFYRSPLLLHSADSFFSDDTNNIVVLATAFSNHFSSIGACIGLIDLIEINFFSAAERNFSRWMCTYAKHALDEIMLNDSAIMLLNSLFCVMKRV